MGTSFFHSCQKDSGNNDAPPAEASKISAALPQQWMDMAYNTVKRQGMFALDASRLYAYAAITAYESLVHAVPNGLLGGPIAEAVANYAHLRLQNSAASLLTIFAVARQLSTNRTLRYLCLFRNFCDPIFEAV